MASGNGWCIFFFLMWWSGIVLASPVENVVVMMLENRAFDHMLGYYGRDVDKRVDGLVGDECNSGVCVNDDAQEVCPYDPNHSFAATTERIFGCEWGKTAGTPCTEVTMTNGTRSMGGFVASAQREGRDGRNEMSMWRADRVPIITSLAQNFALFDRFFASHPGSTYPNRQFVLSATAHGMTDTGNQVPKGGFPQKTVLRSLEEANLTWRMHYEDSLAWAIFLRDVQRPEARPHIQRMDAFYADAANGTLANFTFLEPRISANKAARNSSTYGLPNHQHPRASVQEGERWMKNVYEALRKGPLWEQTLLIVTYDEHGGFYDHVPPPQTGVPSPDGICTKEGFNYERLGIRIPTIAISPWIERNTLVHEAPDAQKPDRDTSQLELSSIPATLRRIFPQLGAPLNRRDAWAATFEHLWATRTAPRTDCPLELPDVPPPPEGEMDRLLALPVDEHAQGLMDTLCQIPGATAYACSAEERAKVATYHEFAPWVERVWEALGPWGGR